MKPSLARWGREVFVGPNQCEVLFDILVKSNDSESETLSQSSSLFGINMGGVNDAFGAEFHGNLYWIVTIKSFLPSYVKNPRCIECIRYIAHTGHRCVIIRVLSMCTLVRFYKWMATYCTVKASCCVSVLQAAGSSERAEHRHLRRKRSVWTRLGWQRVTRRPSASAHQGFWSFMNKYRWRARVTSTCRREYLKHGAQWAGQQCVAFFARLKLQ